MSSILLFEYLAAALVAICSIKVLNCKLSIKPFSPLPKSEFNSSRVISTCSTASPSGSTSILGSTKSFVVALASITIILIGCCEFGSEDIATRIKSARFFSFSNHCCVHETLSKLISTTKSSFGISLWANALAVIKPKASSGPKEFKAMSNTFCGKVFVNPLISFSSSLSLEVAIGKLFILSLTVSANGSTLLAKTKNLYTPSSNSAIC